MTRRLVIRWGPGEKVTARLAIGDVSRSTGILLAHGAGAGQDHPFMVALRDALHLRGFPVMTFNYAHVEAGRRAPDRAPQLLAVHRAAADRLAGYCDRVILAGKSMGGRIASCLVGDEGWDAAGLVYYGYPLVPLGKKEPRDTAHLRAIPQPQLFFSGTRDRLSPPGLIAAVAARCPAATVETIPEADHSFEVPVRTGRTQLEVIAALAATTATWARQRLR